MKRVVVSLALSLGALGAVLAACGAKPSARAPIAPESSAPSSGAASPMPGDPRNEIKRLFDEVEKQRNDLHMAEPSGDPGSESAMPMSVTPLSTAATCKPAKTERCTSSCTLSDSICTNAAKICDLAQELVGDRWAADKCSRSKQTCEGAHASCCGCE